MKECEVKAKQINEDLYSRDTNENEDDQVPPVKTGEVLFKESISNQDNHDGILKREQEIDNNTNSADTETGNKIFRRLSVKFDALQKEDLTANLNER